MPQKASGSENDKNKQHPDLAGPQKHKKFAKIEWRPDQALGLAKLKKHFVTNKPLAMHDLKKQTKLQTNVSDRTIKAMVFQQRKFLDYYSKKLTLAEINYITGKKNVRGGGNIETLATPDTKNKIQNVRSY